MQSEKGPSHQERWLVSYADFITLLFAFFVVMFASSQINQKKVSGIATSFESYMKHGQARRKGVTAQQRADARPADDLHGLAQRELATVQARLERALAQEIKDHKIALSMQPRGLVLSLRESALFPPGSDTFSPEALPILSKIARALQNLAGQPVRLEGHTDNAPIETLQFPSNWELSAARGMAILELLVAKFGIEPERLAVAGYAEFHPVAANDTPEGRTRNRRVDIVVLSRSAAEMEPRQKSGEVNAN